jgi:hypothetical protein
MKKSLTEVPVISYDDHYRSRDDRPVHTAIEGGGYEKGEDALVNSLLLAKWLNLGKNHFVSFGLGFDLQSRSKGRLAQQAVLQQVVVPRARNPQKAGYRICA